MLNTVWWKQNSRSPPGNGERLWGSLLLEPRLPQFERAGDAGSLFSRFSDAGFSCKVLWSWGNPFLSTTEAMSSLPLCVSRDHQCDATLMASCRVVTQRTRCSRRIFKNMRGGCATPRAPQARSDCIPLQQHSACERADTRCRTDNSVHATLWRMNGASTQDKRQG